MKWKLVTKGRPAVGPGENRADLITISITRIPRARGKARRLPRDRAAALKEPMSRQSPVSDGKRSTEISLVQVCGKRSRISPGVSHL